MTPNPAIMNSVERLGYRVTTGDVATQAGLEINFAQQGLLALANDAGGHLQVSDTGEIVYLFPQNFRGVLRNKYLKLQLQEWWQKIWKVLFYLIRISFGIVLILSIILMLVAIVVIVVALSSKDNDNGGGGGNHREGGGGGMFFFPSFWISPDFFWVFSPDYDDYRRQKREKKPHEMNFLEAVYSFLFGDGNPNENLDERRWHQIATVIRNNQGAVVAEQIIPYLDELENYNTSDNEDYMLSVLTRFNGYPQVSPNGEIIYYFPDLQISASQQGKKSIEPYLQENLWRFSRAGSGQIILAIGLGGLNVILALMLGSLLSGETAAQLGSFIAFVASIYWLLLGYGIGFLVIPLIRYLWLQNRNTKIEQRNQMREVRAKQLSNADDDVLKKILYARQFAHQKVITDEDITYSTETDLIEQDLKNADKIDQEWQRRLESGS